VVALPVVAVEPAETSEPSMLHSAVRTPASSDGRVTASGCVDIWAPGAVGGMTRSKSVVLPQKVAICCSRQTGQKGWKRLRILQSFFGRKRPNSK
jgi:hypothetical protein